MINKIYLMACFLCVGIIMHAQTAPIAKLVIPVGHTAGITSVDVSPDGRYYITGSLDQTIKIWDETGLEIRTLARHTKNVLAVAFSPKSKEDPGGGKYILSGSSDHTAILWDILGNFKGKFIEPNDQGVITSVAFSPTAPEFLLGSKSGTTWLLNAEMKEMLRFTAKTEVNSVAFAPDGNLLLTACANHTAMLWNRSKPDKATMIFSAHTAAVLSAVFSSSGDSLLTGSADGTAILWKVTGEKIRTFSHSGAVQQVAFSPDGKKVITGSSDGSIKIWNLSDKDANPNPLYEREISSLKFLPGGQWILSSSKANTAAKIINLQAKTVRILKGHTSAITAMTISPDGASLLVGHADSTAKLWDLASQKVQSFHYPGKLESVAFSPKLLKDTISRDFFVTGCEDKICRIQDMSGKVENPVAPANRAVFSPDGHFLLTGNSDGTLKYWNLATKEAIRLTHSERMITALAFSPINGSKAFAIGSYDGRVLFWDSIGAAPITFELRNAPRVNALAFSPDGARIAIGAEGGFTEVRYIRSDSITEYPNRNLGVENVRSVVFSPTFGVKDQYLLRTSGNNAERWNLANDQITVFTGHTSELTAAIFSPNGATIFTASKDGTIKVWDTQSGKQLATMVSINSEDWAVVNATGLNDASPDAMKLLYYVAGLDVISLKQIKERYYEPGLLAKVTGFSSDSIRNVSRIDTLSLYPLVNMDITGNLLEVSLQARNGGIGRLSLYVNKKRVEEDINPNRLKKLPPIDLSKYNNRYRSDTVNTIGLISYGVENVLRSQPIEKPYRPVRARGEGGGADELIGNNCQSADPQIYLIVVGTSKYQDSTINLAYPDQDAAAMAQTLSGIGNAMRPGRVHLKHYSTSPGNGVMLATKESIKAGFEEFAQLATPCDILVVYFSGHGKNWAPEDGKRSKFYYLTRGISSGKIRDDALRNAHAISDGELELWLNTIPAQKQVLILDACHSGQAAENIKLKGANGGKELNSNQMIALNILNDRTGTWILSGSMAGMRSWEASKYGQGLLTYSLLEGMNGAALDIKNRVDVNKLFDHAMSAVPEMARSIGEVQTPVPLRSGSSFPIGIKDASVVIQLPQPKIVFTTSDFIDDRFFKDTLKLGEALNDYFYAQRLKGKTADYVYYETTNSLENAYRVQGIYSENGDKEIVTGNLFKGDNPVGQAFHIEGPRDKMQLRNLILKEIIPRIPKAKSP